MIDFEIYNNFEEPVCIFSLDNNILFKNKSFLFSFGNYSSIDKFKKSFNFNICFLSLDNITKMTPIDILLSSQENFHTICTYQNINDEYLFYYIYLYIYKDCKVVVFKDVTAINSFSILNSKYDKLKNDYAKEKEDNEKFLKMQELSQAQVSKMGIINRLSMIIRETNDIESILSSALSEIHNLFGSFKTYFSMREKNMFRIRYSVEKNNPQTDLLTHYEESVLNQIKDKNIVVSSCLKEFLNTDEILPKGVKRIIIPLYSKNKLLGIIVTLTKQKFFLDENKEVLQSISVQISSSIIQAGLIQQLNKKNKKLEKTLTELKEMQIQLINTEKMASIGQLVSGVAHEINTPLASINSNNELIKRIISSDDNISTKKLEMLRELNSIDIEATKRISGIVKSLKRFVRLDEREFQIADINKELDLTLKLIAHEIGDNIEVKREYSNIPGVMCCVNMMNQVFMNLLVNACHSIDKSVKDAKITIITCADDKNLTVKIKDTGCGIPQNIQNKIFNVGFTTKKIGTGLGLAISKKIIQLHKGSMNFISKEGVGTEFIISIPLENSTI